MKDLIIRQWSNFFTGLHFRRYSFNYLFIGPSYLFRCVSTDKASMILKKYYPGIFMQFASIVRHFGFNCLEQCIAGIGIRNKKRPVAEKPANYSSGIPAAKHSVDQCGMEMNHEPVLNEIMQ